MNPTIRVWKFVSSQDDPVRVPYRFADDRPRWTERATGMSFPYSTPTHLAIIQELLLKNPFALSGSNRAALVSRIDDVLPLCEHVVRLLKTKRNECSDITRWLPDELLARVFKYVVCDKKGSLACIPLTYVCHRWRDIVVGCTDLWSHIVATEETSVEMLGMLIKQAKSSPLTVHFPDLSWIGSANFDEEDGWELERRLERETSFRK